MYEFWDAMMLRWWQWPLTGLAVCVGILGGGGLLLLGARWARARKPRYWTCVRTVFLAELASWAAASGVLMIFLMFAGQTGRAEVAVFGSVLSRLASLAITWVIISRTLGISFVKGILAWLPTLGQLLVALPLVYVVCLPMGDIRWRIQCAGNLEHLYGGLSSYSVDHRYRLPPTLEETRPFLDLPERLECPAGRHAGTSSPYFYYYSSDDRFNPNTTEQAKILACDLPSAHGGYGVGVLFATGHAEWFAHDEFERILAREENRAFAAAYRQVRP